MKVKYITGFPGKKSKQEPPWSNRTKETTLLETHIYPGRHHIAVPPYPKDTRAQHPQFPPWPPGSLHPQSLRHGGRKRKKNVDIKICAPD